MRAKYDEFINEGSLIVLEGTVLDMMTVYDELDAHIVNSDYDVRCFGFDPYNAKDFVERWATENGPFGIEKVIQGAKTESVPYGVIVRIALCRVLNNYKIQRLAFLLPDRASARSAFSRVLNHLNVQRLAE